MDLSCFTVMTAGLMKTLSDHLSNLMICLVSRKCLSLSTLSAKCRVTLRPLCCEGCVFGLIVNLAMWFLELSSLVHRWVSFQLYKVQ